jgi:hypothetical protein
LRLPPRGSDVRRLPVDANRRPVAAETVAAAEAVDVVGFARALAREGVPAGFVVSADDGVSESTPDSAPSDTPRSLAQAIRRFEGRHADYTSGQRGSAVIVRPQKRTVCDDALVRALPSGPVSVPVYEAFWRLARMVNPGRVPAAPPSVLCNGRCDPNEPAHYTQKVTLRLSGGTLEDALTQMVQQVPGIVWVLRESWSESTFEWTCGLTYFDGAHELTTSYVFASSF